MARHIITMGTGSKGVIDLYPVLIIREEMVEFSLLEWGGMPSWNRYASTPHGADLTGNAILEDVFERFAEEYDCCSMSTLKSTMQTWSGSGVSSPVRTPVP